MIRYKKAKFFIDNRWIYYNEKEGFYNNIMSYFDDNGLSFVKHNPIDFSEIPIKYRGRGINYNLSDFLSNNSSDKVLTSHFLQYYIKKLSLKYDDNTIINWIFKEDLDWRDNSINIIYNEKKVFYIRVDNNNYKSDNNTINVDRDQIYI